MDATAARARRGNEPLQGNIPRGAGQLLVVGSVERTYGCTTVVTMDDRVVAKRTSRRAWRGSMLCWPEPTSLRSQQRLSFPFNTRAARVEAISPCICRVPAAGSAGQASVYVAPGFNAAGGAERELISG